MMFFNKQKQAVGNTRRRKKVVKPVRKPLRWIKPLLQKGVVVGLIMLAGLGLWKLNQTTTIAYWDIDAEPHIKTQIEAFLSQQKQLDYWHSRAQVLHQALINHVPDIQYLQVSRVLPDGVLVKAVARRPMALWKNNNLQQVMLIDENGVPYRSLQRGETLDLPLLRVEEQALTKATHLLLALDTFDVKKLLNLSEVIMAERGWRLNFAKGEQWKVSDAHLKQDLAQIINVLDMPRWAKRQWRIDARVSERWFIRPAKQEVI